ncbi:hypothetical protein RMS29_000010 [Agrobacterium rosae]|uniref:Uncharacterized protein n=1 Tax=Agrobacterium rosae TaxID=1972867 RepID=A0AAE5S0U7_9HYPH|nr:hypothetical protein [Agrobacterium rosae]KAA3511087.1 hypothetical protein DXM21_16390 [Agrobacterium rosae]KAA3518125.1 hypothetical protein DXM25_16440 [Agrobacterium rosae]MCM2434428.1 hypothetical protein [Agrobacterium rosae]MDX8329304.1 hypothetical protein [Agrobacterium rosae]MQB49710.1 hypothetical protein [Agrobacterium rosae]
MRARHTSNILARVIYCLEILLFAAPFYLTYGLVAVISAPFAGLLILFSPVWFTAYLVDANGEVGQVFLASVVIIAIATLSWTSTIALWKLAKLSYIYVFKGAQELLNHWRDFRIGLYCGLAPLVFTTLVMASVVVSDGGWTSLPFAIIGGGVLLFPVTHLWIAMSGPK